MNRFLLLFILFVALQTSAQNIKIIKISRDYVRHPDVEGFNYLHEDMTENTYQWIGQLRIDFDTIFPTTLKTCYNKFSEKANKLSSNAFRVVNADLYSEGDRKFIEIGLYYLHRENRNENLAYFQNGKIYLFGFLGHHQDIEGYNLTVNNEKMVLEELRYKLYQPAVGRTLKVKLGRAFKADQVSVKIEKDMLPRYYTFQVYKGFFRRGLINEHEWSFGEMLARILQKETLKL